MKLLKQLGILLIFIAIVTAGLSLVLPTSQKIERTATINAPSGIIYEKLKKLENFNSITVWNQRDSSAKYSLSGTDGNIGSSYSWVGDPSISGTGKMTITSLGENKIEHALEFTKPKKGKANSVFTLNEIDGSTTVTWTFHMITPRPWNIFNLFYSMDEEMGADFDEGLARLKKMLDPVHATEPVAKNLDIKTLNFSAVSYATIRQLIKWEDMPAFYREHLSVLNREVGENSLTPGTPVSMIYSWDEKKREVDYAVAIPVATGTKIENPIVRIIEISDSKAIYTDHIGPGKTNESYPLIRKYMSENKLNGISPIIEQQFPIMGGDSTKRTTRIIFLVESY